MRSNTQLRSNTRERSPSNRCVPLMWVARAAADLLALFFHNEGLAIERHVAQHECVHVVHVPVPVERRLTKGGEQQRAQLSGVLA